MATLTYFVKIGTTELTKIKKYKVGRNKLWTDAGRNMAGELKATLVGIFPKISMEFAHLTRAEMKALVALLDPSSLSVTYWDEKTETYKTGTYYAGDYELSFFDKTKGYYEPMSVSLIPFSKES